MYEVVDNSVDEALAGVCDHIEVVIGKDLTVTVCTTAAFLSRAAADTASALKWCILSYMPVANTEAAVASGPTAWESRLSTPCPNGWR